MKLLSKNHIISGNEWFRQKIHDLYSSDNYAISKFIGKWTSIKYLLGQVWYNKRLKDLGFKQGYKLYKIYSTPTFLEVLKEGT